MSCSLCHYLKGGFPPGGLQTIWAMLGFLLLAGGGLQARPASEDLFAVAQLAFQEAQKAPKEDREGALLQAERWLKRFVQKAPDHPKRADGYYLLATCYAQLNRPDEARQAYLEVYQREAKGPLAGAAAFQLGKESFRAERWEEAGNYLQRASQELTPGKAQAGALYLAALSQHKRGQKEQSQTLHQNLLSQKSAAAYHGRSHLALGQLAEEEQDLASAHHHYREAAQRLPPPKRAEVILKSGLLARQLGKKAEAKRSFKEVLQTPSLQEWHSRVGLFLAHDASQAEAWEEVVSYQKWGEQMLTQEQKKQRLLLFGQAYLRLGQADQARPFFRQLAQEAKGSPYGFEAAYHLLTLSVAPTERELKDFLTQYQSPPYDQTRLMNAQLLYAELLFKKQRYAEALARYQMLELDQLESANHPMVAHRIAWATYRLGRTEDAATAMRAFLARYPNHPQAPQITLSYAVLLAQEGSPRKALEQLEPLLDQSAHSDQRQAARLLSARLWAQTGQFEKALKGYRQLASDQTEQGSPTEQAESQFWQGYCLFQLNFYQEARPHLEKARTLQPTPYAAQATPLLAHLAYHLKDAQSLRAELSRAESSGLPALPSSLYFFLAYHFTQQDRASEAWPYYVTGFSNASIAAQSDSLLLSYAQVAEEVKEYQQLSLIAEQLQDRALTPYQTAQNLYWSALATYHLKGGAAAQAETQAAIRMNVTGPLKYKLLLLEGLITLENGEPGDAERLLLQVVELAGQENWDEKEVALRALIGLVEKREDPLRQEKRARYRSSLRSHLDSSPR